MRVIGLWNPSHMEAQTTLSSAVEPLVALFVTSDTSSQSIVWRTTPWSSWYSANVVTFRNRQWLQFNSLSSTVSSCTWSIGPDLSTNPYAELIAKGATKAYHGLRIYVNKCKTGAMLLSGGATAATAYYSVTAGSEYYIEVVDDLLTGTRTVYVNGAVVTVPSGNARVSVGDFSGSLCSVAGHSWYITDYYFAIAEAGDVDPPARLGKIAVKTLKPTGVVNDDKFTVVGSETKSIIDVLTQSRRKTTAAQVTEYVKSDPLDSKMGLLYTAPNNGDEVLGAVLVTEAFIEDTANTRGRIDINGTTLNLNLDFLTGTLLYTRAVCIAKPFEEWSEAALGELDIKVYSSRTV